MTQQNQKLSDRIDAGVKMAIASAIEKHRKLGQSISIWQDGKVVTLSADEIPPQQDGEGGHGGTAPTAPYY